MPERVIITDVGPRDGLQNQPKILSLEQRISLVHAIAASGVANIEVGSFVSPKSGACHGRHRSGFCRLAGR